jgi:heptosyltransferase-1
VNILIVKLSAIGDVIHTLPALADLRRLYPDADITWVVEEAAADLLAGHPALNRTIISHRKSWLKEMRRGRIATPLREMQAFWKELRQRPYDLVIDFHGLFKSAVIVLASGGKRRLGYDSLQEGSGLFYNEKIPEAMEKHAVDRYLDFVRYLADAAGSSRGSAAPQADPTFTIAVGPEECGRVAALLDAHTEMRNGEDGRQGDKKESGGGEAKEGRFVAVSPVALWETKLWEDGKFAALCDRIRRELGIGVVLTGGEAAPLERIGAQMETRAVNLGGQTTLRELACLYRQAALVITTDSGPMHIAAAMGTPVVALFGPTDPARTGPYGPEHKVIRSGIACAPCLRKQCDTQRCMREIGVAEVFAAVREVLEKERETGRDPSATETSWCFFDGGQEDGNQQGTVGNTGMPPMQGGGPPESGRRRPHLRGMPPPL